MRIRFEQDEGYCAAALGLIVLTTDETLEPEIAPCLAKSGVAAYHSRIKSDPDVTPETLLQMEADLPRAAGMLPDSAKLKAVAYGCTSGATVIGPERIEALVQTSHPGVPVTNPLTAVLAACRSLGVMRLGLLTPYVPSVSSAMQKVIEQQGITISAFASFEQQEERTVARISEVSVLAALCELGQGDCDAVFASCTNLRSFSIIDAAEAKIGKPVLSSNSALLWHLGQLSGYPVGGPGRLFAQGLSQDA